MSTEQKITPTGIRTRRHDGGLIIITTAPGLEPNTTVELTDHFGQPLARCWDMESGELFTDYERAHATIELAEEIEPGIYLAVDYSTITVTFEQARKLVKILGADAILSTRDWPGTLADVLVDITVSVPATIKAAERHGYSAVSCPACSYLHPVRCLPGVTVAHDSAFSDFEHRFNERTRIALCDMERLTVG